MGNSRRDAANAELHRAMIRAAAIAAGIAIVAGALNGWTIYENIDRLVEERLTNMPIGRRYVFRAMMLHWPMILGSVAACWAICKFAMADGTAMIPPILLGAAVAWASAFLVANAAAPGNTDVIVGALIQQTIFFCVIGTLWAVRD